MSAVPASTRWPSCTWILATSAGTLERTVACSSGFTEPETGIWRPSGTRCISARSPAANSNTFSPSSCFLRLAGLAQRERAMAITGGDEEGEGGDDVERSFEEHGVSLRDGAALRGWWAALPVWMPGRAVADSSPPLDARL
jgi:hypothetical protein